MVGVVGVVGVVGGWWLVVGGNNVIIHAAQNAWRTDYGRGGGGNMGRRR